jgi:hypothetical protein
LLGSGGGEFDALLGNLGLVDSYPLLYQMEEIGGIAGSVLYGILALNRALKISKSADFMRQNVKIREVFSLQRVFCGLVAMKCIIYKEFHLL